MGLLIIVLGKSFLENREVNQASNSQWHSSSLSSMSHTTTDLDDFMDEEMRRLSNPYETPGVDINIDHDYHGMNTRMDD